MLDVCPSVTSMVHRDIAKRSRSTTVWGVRCLGRRLHVERTEEGELESLERVTRSRRHVNVHELTVDWLVALIMPAFFSAGMRLHDRC